jgi:hypothetical protein
LPILSPPIQPAIEYGGFAFIAAAGYRRQGEHTATSSGLCYDGPHERTITLANTDIGLP